MRITVNIADEVWLCAKDAARAHGITLSAYANRVLREALAKAPEEPSSDASPQASEPAVSNRKHRPTANSQLGLRARPSVGMPGRARRGGFRW